VSRQPRPKRQVSSTAYDRTFERLESVRTSASVPLTQSRLQAAHAISGVSCGRVFASVSHLAKRRQGEGVDSPLHNQDFR
jgi:hypothetical protein